MVEYLHRVPAVHQRDWFTYIKTGWFLNLLIMSLTTYSGECTLRTYDDICNKTIELGNGTFAGKLHFEYRPTQPDANTYRCNIVIKTLRHYFLSLHFQTPMQLSRCSGHPCCSSRLFFPGTGPLFCIADDVPTDSFSRYNEVRFIFESDNENVAYFNIVFFTYRLSDYCSSSEVKCGDKCIHTRLSCETDYDFCVGHNLTCQDAVGDIVTSGSAIAGIVTTCVLMVILGCVCYMCVGKQRICRFKNFFRRNTERDEQFIRRRNAAIFSVQLATRGVNSAAYEEETDEENIDPRTFESPPEYSSLQNIHNGEYRQSDDSSRNAHIVSRDTTRYANDQPPAYEEVICNLEQYEVNM